MKSGLRVFLGFLAGLIIFIGLPMLGWGIFQIPHFFDDPARTAYVVVMALLQLFAVLYLPQAGGNKQARKDGIAQRKIDLYVIQSISLAIVFLAPFSDRTSLGTFNPGDAIRYFGLILAVFGFILMLLAEKALGGQFSVEVTLQEDHKLVMAGPYKFVRHPRYLGVITFFLGISFVFRSYIAIFFVIVLFIVLIWRIFAEESLMREEFGAEWDAYCAKTSHMIPFLF